MKWTKEKKKKALELYDNGTHKKDIPDLVGMSFSSVNNLITQERLDYDERVKCQICGGLFKSITQLHLNKHHISFDEYVKKFPNSKTVTNKRTALASKYKNPNKGKTYEKIYGVKEAKRKKNKISKKQIGRRAPKLVGTGITGTRRDTNKFARSTYEANVDRIFQFEKKSLSGEFDKNNFRWHFLDENGIEKSYQPDRIDQEGLFLKDAYLEIKGYMRPEDWEKIQLFRKYSKKDLIVISKDEIYADVNYKDLEDKYKLLIPLWETEHKNYRTRPDLYKIDYISKEREEYLTINFKNNIFINIKDEHKRFVCQKAVNFAKIKFGQRIFVNDVKLIKIANKRKGATRRSSGVYNYELWEVVTENYLGNEKKIFYVSNISKTVQFYCYLEENSKKLFDFFEGNHLLGLSYGKKE